MLRGRPAPPLPGWHAPSLTSPLRFPALEPAGRVLPSGHVLPSETGGARGGWNLWEDSDAFICTFCLTLESDFFFQLGSRRSGSRWAFPGKACSYGGKTAR